MKTMPLKEITERTEMTMQDRYLDPHQARRRVPTEYENLFGDTLEHGFAAGLRDLPALADHFNLHGPAAHGGGAWTADTLAAELARLAA